MSAMPSLQVIGRHCVTLPWLRWRSPTLGSEQLALIASLYFAAACNTTFFGAVIETGALHGVHGWWTGVGLFVAIAALHFVLLCVLFTRWTAKPVLVVLLLSSALAVHFMRDYTVYFDTDMIRNILHTDPDEAGELLNAGLVPSFLLLGVLPSALVCGVRIRRRAWPRAAWIRVLSIAIALLVAAIAIMSSFQSVSSLMRNHRELRHLVTPGNYLVSLLRVAGERPSRPKGPKVPVGMRARVVGRPVGARPRVLVLVVGETLRAQNWGLNGYARDTTPALRRIDPVNFSDVTSCGSNTEVSLPCMFSDIGRANYDKQRIESRESLLNVLDHAGIATRWIDNQSGCKHVCDGIAYTEVTHGDDRVLCDGTRCLDGVLVGALSRALDETRGDRVIVLHMLGNHGPAYFNRYPRDARTYSPECRSEELASCSREEIVNAYDNAIRYTDRVLAGLVATLQGDVGVDGALVYVSDHGESLGEDGVYLHGLPYSIAPRTQVQVPMIMWFSPGLQASRGLDVDCLRGESSLPVSHDNLFSSILGLMQVRAPEYRPDLDLFRPCLPATGA